MVFDSKIQILLLCIFLCTSVSAAYPPVLTEVIPREPSIVDTVISAYVAKVVDGETLGIRVTNGVANVKIYGIATPDGAWGKKAREYLQWKVEHKQVALEIIGRDKHGRPTVRVYREGSDVGLSLVGMGLARSRPPTDPVMAQTAEAAKARGIGMWGKK